MKRSLLNLSSQKYDVIIIGGGITGACVAWDAVQRGLTVALFEKRDFAAATSSATTKLIHGGLRYLKNLEFTLVRESLRERRIMEKIAPHLVYPIPFIIPTYSLGEKIQFWTGMVLYDILSYDKKWIEDEEKKIPRFKTLSKEEITNLIPRLDSPSLNGGLLYYDCQMYSPERLVLEFILSACEHGAAVANYAEVVKFLREKDRITGVEVRDILTNSTFEVSGQIVLNCTGPWADLLAGEIRGDVKLGLIRSKGIHIIIKPLIEKYALVLRTPKRRHLFFIPWRGHTLVGTTDTQYLGHPDDFKVTAEDLAELIRMANETCPLAKISDSDVIFFYGGLRPIVEQETEVAVEVYRASRKYEIYDHERDIGLKGLLTAIGGKYTTSRHLAERIVARVLKKLGRKAVPGDTQETRLSGGATGRYKDFLESWRRRYPQLSVDILENLCRSYGSNIGKVLAYGHQNPKSLERISGGTVEIYAQILYAIHHEMALTLEDIVFRRTGLGLLGNPGREVIACVAEEMARELKWNAGKRLTEIDRVQARFSPG